MPKATKIIATIGPATESEEAMNALIRAGMNVARFNTKHSDPIWHKTTILRLRQVAEKLNEGVAVFLDLQGPEVRLNLPGGQPFTVHSGQVVKFVSSSDSANPIEPVVPQMVITSLHKDCSILIDDGTGEFVVEEIGPDYLLARAQSEFVVKDRKTLNTPGIVMDMPSLIDRDMAVLDQMQDNMIDYVGLSFVRNKADIEVLRQELAKRQIHAQIVAKIENQSALDNIDEIIDNSDAVMVARGDLGVEVAYQELTFWQKTIIAKCRNYGKPVITATQMLKSMVDNPRPTRAEVSDVAHAIYDGTDAVMLSEETTIGKYPVNAVMVQHTIAVFNEPHATYLPFQPIIHADTDRVTHAAIELVQASRDQNETITKIICFTETGRTAKLLARYRPHVPIIALTSNPLTYHTLAMVYGVQAHVINLEDDHRLDSHDAIREILNHYNLIVPEDRCLVIHGIIWKNPGKTNTMSLLSPTQV